MQVCALEFGDDARTDGGIKTGNDDGSAGRLRRCPQQESSADGERGEARGGEGGLPPSNMEVQCAGRALRLQQVYD
jgi:hypothetical protein